MQRVNSWAVLGAVTVLNLSLAICSLVYGQFQTRVVTFDKDAVLKQFVIQLSQKPLKEAETDKLSNRFAKALKTSINDYAREKNAIVIKRDTVLASQADVTSLIAKKIADKMRGQL